MIELSSYYMRDLIMQKFKTSLLLSLIAVGLITTNSFAARVSRKSSRNKARTTSTAAAISTMNADQPEEEPVEEIVVDKKNEIACFKIYRNCMDKQIDDVVLDKHLELMDDYQDMTIEYYTETDVPPFRCAYKQSIVKDYLDFHFGITSVDKSQNNYPQKKSIEYYKALSQQINDLSIGIINPSNLDEKILSDARSPFPTDLNEAKMTTANLRFADYNASDYLKQATLYCQDSKKIEKLKGCEKLLKKSQDWYFSGSEKVHHISVNKSCKEYNTYLSQILNNAEKEYEELINANSDLITKKVKEYNEKIKKMKKKK